MTFRADGDADCDRCGGLIPRGNLRECVQIMLILRDPDSGIATDLTLHLCLRDDESHDRCAASHVLTTAALAHRVTEWGGKPAFARPEDDDPVDPAATLAQVTADDQ